MEMAQRKETNGFHFQTSISYIDLSQMCNKDNKHVLTSWWSPHTDQLMEVESSQVQNVIVIFQTSHLAWMLESTQESPIKVNCLL